LKYDSSQGYQRNWNLTIKNKVNLGILFTGSLTIALQVNLFYTCCFGEFQIVFDNELGIKIDEKSIYS